MLQWLTMMKTKKRGDIKKSSILIMMTMIGEEKRGGIKKGTEMAPSIMENAI